MIRDRNSKPRRQYRTFVAALLTLGIATTFSNAAAAQDQATTGRIAPEGASGVIDKGEARAQRFMVAAANPLAVNAGYEILQKGGSAVDAAIATQLVLNLVEPQSSGIGGGAFILHFDRSANKVRAYDGRETAPSSATPDRFLRNGKRMPFRTAVNSGLSVGVPGLVRLMELAHQRHGKLPWADLFQPAINLSRSGFKVSPRLNTLLTWYGANRFTPKARAYFFDNSDSPRPVGHLLKNPEFADTLEEIANGGADAFYNPGRISNSIIDAVANAPNATAVITPTDISDYRAIEREPVCITYRRQRVCGMPPPSSGGITVAQTLKLLEPFELAGGDADAMRPEALHLIAEAQKLAYADRNRYLADSDFVTPPTGLLAPNYLDRRRQLISKSQAMARPKPGVPHASAQNMFGTDATIERAGTSHISIVDADGNAVSMTTTIEGGFGSGLWASGFLLNNELTDFSFHPVDREGRPIANRVEPLKRPRSSMSPTLVFNQDGSLHAALGSVGGSRIILYVAKSLIGLVDWKLGAKEIADLPNFGSRGRHFEVELGLDTIWQGLKVKPYGHQIVPGLMTSGTHIIIKNTDGSLTGAADPRREGTARGE